MAILPLALALASCGSAAPDAGATPEPSVLVSMIRPLRGSLPRIVTAYGSVGPSVSATQTFSEPQPGQVSRLRVAPGSVVGAGQPLATFVTAPSSRSLYEQATSTLAAARQQRATTTQLLGQQFATRDQLVQAEKAVSDARTALAALGAEGAGTPAHTIVAPFAGVVTAVTVAQGDRIQAGTAILTVARAGGIVVTAGIDPARRGALAAGQRATLVRLSGGAPLTGRVIRVDGMLNPTTRQVDVDFAFPAGALLTGEAMRVAIETGHVAGWVVPHAAVVTAGGQTRIFQVRHGKAIAVPVAIHLASEDGDVVEGPLYPTLPLIVTGAYQVTDGDAVRRNR